MLLRAASLSFLALGVASEQTSRLQIHIPASLRKEGGYDHRDALFGVPPYGGSIHQQLYYADSTLCDPNVDTHSGHPKEKGGWKTPFILMIDRGDCGFIQQVRHAQKSGATAVLIADNLCRCDMEDCDRGDTDGACQVQEPIMADDGSGHDISIPSFLVFKEDADEIKKVLLKDTHVRAEMSFKVPAPDSRVEYELWSHPSDPHSRSIEGTFGAAASALGYHAFFTPHTYIYDGFRAGCQVDGKNQCFDLCTNNGRYCSTDPDGNMGVGSSGADVVVESLRRLCIWKEYGSDGIGEAWWSYVKEFMDRCNPQDDSDMEGLSRFNDPSCVSEVMNSIAMNEDRINDCMESSGGADVDTAAKNRLLEKELQDQESSGVVVIPSLLVNKAVVHGELAFATAFKAVCSGFSLGSEPAICLKCANCRDEYSCVQQGHCSADNGFMSSGGISLTTFFVVLVGLTTIFCFIAYYIYDQQQRNMRNQIEGIVAEYMPVTAQNKAGTSMALGPDEDDEDPIVDHESFSIE